MRICRFHTTTDSSPRLGAFRTQETVVDLSLMGWHEIAGLFEGQAQEAIQSAWEAPEAVTHEPVSYTHLTLPTPPYV